LASACVPASKLKDEQANSQLLQKQKTLCNEQLEEYMQNNKALQRQIDSLDKLIALLKKDTARNGNQYRKTLQMNKELNDLYEKVISRNKDLAAVASAERERLSVELQSKQMELEKKDNALKEKESELDRKEQEINELSLGLMNREKRVKELESLIGKKDSAIARLKADISKALLSFDEDELTVEIRDGKIYVSLAEQLLFKSGSIAVDPKGLDALNKLAGVLKDQANIDVLIEGHTDNVPIKTQCIKDNWDLSVLRATSIVRALTKDDQIDPKRIIPSGRGAFKPLATNETADGRSKNRRTEIILSPRRDELFKILGNY